jgi:phosphoglycolate phosphatase
MAVLSNKPHDFTVRYVEAYFGRYAFAVVRGQSDRFPVKPDPASALDIARRIGRPPADFLFVGDSIADVQAATAARMHAVGVGWGFRGPGELEAGGCRTVVHHPLDIAGLVG